jgi:NAD(P)-dependent dehydrogenase (short-subunit alcohol dehydrogenase family)
MKDFAGKIAFITGGASGAGFGQAQLFGRAGCRIAIADIRQSAIDEALEKLRAEGIEAEGFCFDLTDRAAYAKAADAVEAHFGRAPQLLFNTAGVNSFGPVEATTFGDFDWLINVNLGAVINGMVIFVPRMIAAGGEAHIVTVSSAGGFRGSAGAAPYCAAKAAVINLMESYRESLAKHDIGVSVVCPANIKSNIAEATRIRPAESGETGYVVNDDTVASLHSIHVHGMEPLDLAGHIKSAIEKNELYIIPYPEMAEGLRKHFDDILSAIPPLDSDPEGVKQRTEAFKNWVADRTKMFGQAREDATEQA